MNPPGRWMLLFLVCLSSLMTVGSANAGRPAGPGSQPLTLHWHQEFRLGGGGYAQDAVVQYLTRNASGTGAKPFEVAGFETWWGSPWRPIHRTLAIDLFRSSAASDTIRWVGSGRNRNASGMLPFHAIPGSPDPMRLRLGWRLALTWNDTPFFFFLVWLHPGECALETPMARKLGPLYLFGALTDSPRGGAQPASGSRPDSGGGAEAPAGVGGTSPGSAGGAPSPDQGGSGNHAGVGAAMPMGGDSGPERPKPGTSPAMSPPPAPLVIPVWVALFLLVAVVLLTLVSVRQLLKGREKSAPRPVPVAPSGEKQVEAYARLQASLADLQENECQKKLDQYFDFVDREPALMETEAARFRLLLDQTASRLALRQYEPGPNGGSVRDMERVHAGFWRQVVRLLRNPDTASFWRALIDESWEPLLIGHMMRALHFLEQGRQQPLLDLRDGLLAILQVSPETARRVGVDGFLQALAVALADGPPDPVAGLAALEAAGQPFPPAIVGEWKRIGDSAISGKALLARLESQGVILATLNLLKNARSGPLRMHAVHVPPRHPSELPTIAFFHLEPTSAHQVLRSRMKGFNLALAIRHDDDDYELLMRNRNTDDTFHFPITSDTAQEIGRFSQQCGGRCTLALIDAQDLRVTFLPRHETPLDPTGETWRILEMIHGGSLREAIARWQRLPPHGAPLSDVWLELIFSQCNSLSDGEFGVAKKHLQQALRSLPDSWQTLSAMGIICRREGRDIEALDFFARAYQAFPYDVSNLLSYASMLLASTDERTNELIRSLAGLAYDLNPRSTSVQRLLGDLEEAGIASRASFTVGPLDSRIQG